MRSVRPIGWRGYSHEHALAARGIKIYAARKQQCIDPIFLARKEQEVPFGEVTMLLRQGKTFQEIAELYPEASKEAVRKKSIKAYESLEADGTLSFLDRTGVQRTQELVQLKPELKERVVRVLEDRQARSLLHPVKVEMLRKRIV